MADTPTDSISTSPPPLLVVIGAGPKAAALAAKARVLKKLGGRIQILVLEQQSELAGNWTGSCGFTTGLVSLCTPPEKDVGFPYNSAYGSDVDKLMLGNYSWHAYLILADRSWYSNWVDTDRTPPSHQKWAGYIRNALNAPLIGPTPSPSELAEEDIVTVNRDTTVLAVEPENGKVKITFSSKGHTRTVMADGVVFTGPGNPNQIKDSPIDAENLIFDSRSYWKSISQFQKMEGGRVAVIGGGESAASVALSLLPLTGSSGLEIDIINRHGTIFTRGESFHENKWFSNPGTWTDKPEEDREEIIRRTDRGVFSVNAQNQLKSASNVDVKSGHVFRLEKLGDQVKVLYTRKKINKEELRPEDVKEEVYDKVVVGLGFDPWTMLDLLPAEFRPSRKDEDSDKVNYHKKLEREIDFNLRLKLNDFPGMENIPFNVHVPVLAGLAQGPGLPSLCCLGHLSDRILLTYIDLSRKTRKH
jgi:mycobactin lysine-N-oxygenase